MVSLGELTAQNFGTAMPACCSADFCVNLSWVTAMHFALGKTLCPARSKTSSASASTNSFSSVMTSQRPANFKSVSRSAPIADDAVRRESRGGTVPVLFQHTNLHAQRQGGDGRHARQLAAADNAQPHRIIFRPGRAFEFGIVNLVHCSKFFAPQHTDVGFVGHHRKLGEEFLFQPC